MKILLVHNRYRSGTPGGEDAVFEQERSLLERAGLKVITYQRSNDEMHAGSPLDYVRVAAGLQRSGRTTRELRRLLRAESPDVAHFHNTFPLISASGYLVCREFEVPVVQTVHNFGMVCVSRTFFRDHAVCQQCSPGDYGAAIRHRCYRRSGVGSLAVAGMLWRNHYAQVHRRCIDRFIALSPFVADWLRTIGVESHRIIIKPNFVQPLSRPDAEGNRSYAMFAGRIAPEKGIDVLLEAWSFLPDIPLLIFGDGPLMHQAVSAATEKGLNIQFVGSRPRSEVIQAMANARLVVMPSRCFEAAIPLVVLEAWSVGTPVIATRLGSTTYINEGVEALQFESGSASALASQVRTLWVDGDLAAKLAVNGKARFNSEHSSEVSLRKLISIYQSLSDAPVPVFA